MTLQLKTRPQPQKVQPKKSPERDLIIIGGGPAGLTAALYAARARLNVLIIEKMILGGLVTTTAHIDNYPGFPAGVSGMDLGALMDAQVKKLGVEVSWNSAVSISKEKKDSFTIAVDDKTHTAKAVIIATGTEAAKLGVPGEDAFRGRGVSYCATCDGAFYKDKNIAVIGGGNSAVEEALYLTRFAKKVSLVHRRDALRAEKILAEQAIAHPQIYIFWHSVVEQIRGDKQVKEIALKDRQNNNSLLVPVDGVFIYIGSQANSEIVKDLVKLDQHGYIIVDADRKTSLPGLFAAGDIISKSLRQVVTAAADGAIAAESARKYIENELTK